MTADQAEALARLLRELCIIREGQVLHVGGHVIGPLKKGAALKRSTKKRAKDAKGKADA